MLRLVPELTEYPIHLQGYVERNLGIISLT
jgi:hypothetical protein